MMEMLSESEKQLGFIDGLQRRLKEAEREKGRRLTYHVVTFGCQMNAKDSEKLAGILERIGYVPADSEDADFVIYNTCTVRENANLRVYGRLGQMKNKKKKNPDMLIALCGCMMQEPHVVEKIRKSYKHVDIIFGTHNLFRLAELISMRLDTGRAVVDIWRDTDLIVEDLPAERKYPFKTGINIMFGCNNFCTYCIVPYVRGRERSRQPEDIIKEVSLAAEDGVKEIMLLGQNVNSYGKNLNEPMTFAGLLKEVAGIDGIERIRFMTSHPKDLSDELIEVMSSTGKICRHLHLPLQSGSSDILRKMNRHYTREDYMTLVKKIRQACPGISLTTDIIVGFPGETEEDFLETMEIVDEVGFDSAFTFIYSKRTGTPAASMPDQVPDDIIKDRFGRLLGLVQKKAAEACSRFEGMTKPVLVEEVNDHDPALVTGRISENIVVHFPGTSDMIGKIYDVNLIECKGFYYIGRR